MSAPLGSTREACTITYNITSLKDAFSFYSLSANGNPLPAFRDCYLDRNKKFYFSSGPTGKSHHHRSSHDQPSHSEAEVGDDALSGGLNDEKIPGGPGLNERELWSLHRAVPGLRRHDPRTSTMRMHYYVEVCSMFFITFFFLKAFDES